jgi:hypothetical protein
VTGKHLGSSACLDPQGRLNPTLEPVEGGCRHVESGTLLEGDPADGVEDACFDAAGALKTTLAPLIDEDDGQPVDDDDDGRFDEDGPSAPPRGFAADCRQLGKDAGLPDTEAEAMVTPDGGCDLTPMIVKKINEKVEKKTFKTDDPDAPPKDPDNPPIDYSAEEGGRAVGGGDDHLRRGVGARRRGRLCVDDAGGRPGRGGQGAGGGRDGCASRRNDGLHRPARVRWGFFRYDEVCFWFFGCFIFFEAKVGFDFNIGLGFRLFVEVTVSGVPTSPVFAGGNVESLETTLMPLDFDAAQYEAFCLKQTPPINNATYYQRFAFPNTLIPEQKNELTIRFTTFANLKIIIVEIPIVN